MLLRKLYPPLVLVLFFFFSFTANSYANLLVNGGFEKGSFSPWRMSGNLKITTGMPHSGHYALKGKITPAINSGGQISQGIRVNKTGEDISLSGWFYIKKNAGGNIVYRVSGFNKKGKMMALISYVLSGDKDYYKINNRRYYYYKAINRSIFGRVYYRTVVIPTPRNQWYHFTGRSVKEDFSALFPSIWPSLKISYYTISLQIGTPKKGALSCYADDLEADFISPYFHPQVKSLSLEEEKLPAKRAKYRAFFKETENQLSLLKKKFNANDYPEYRTQIKETSQEIIIKRQIYTLFFSKEKADLNKIILNGRVLNNLAFPNLLIIDGKGNEYTQRNAKDGSLSYQDGKFFLTLKGSFTPADKEGRTLPAKVDIYYRIDKMSGLIVLTGKIISTRGPLLIKRLTFSNSLAGVFLNTLYVGGKKITKKVAFKEATWLFRGGSKRYTFATWTNGRIGFQVFPITYFQSKISPSLENKLKSYKYLGVGLEQGAREIYMTFVNMPGGFKIPRAGLKMTYAFSLLPFEKYTPKPIVLSFGYWLPINRSNFTKFTQKDKEDIQKLARAGVTMLSISSNYTGDPYPVDPKIYRQFINYAHLNGIKVVEYFEGNALNERMAILSGRLTKDEVISIRKRSKLLFPHNPEGKIGTWSWNSPRGRLMQLTAIYRLLKDTPLDGFYLDGTYLWPSARDSEGGARPDSYITLGQLKFMKDMRILLDGFGKDKVIIAHSWAEIVPQVDALADFSLPGENINNAKLLSLPMPLLNIAWDSLSTGMQVILYSGRQAYQNDKKDIYRQALAHAVTGYIKANWVLKAGRSSRQGYVSEEYSKKALRLYKKYMLPKIIFNIADSYLYHPYNPDYSDYIKVNNPDVYALLYRKDKKALMIVVKRPEAINKTVGEVKVTLNIKRLKMGGNPAFLVYNTTNSALKEDRAANGTLILNNIDLSPGPQIFLIREKEIDPVILWHDEIIREIKSAQFDKFTKTLKISLKGVTESEGKLWIYSGEYGRPKGIAGAKMINYNRKDKICILSVSIPEKGRRNIVLRF